MKSVMLFSHGDEEVLEVREQEVPTPKRGEVLLRHTAIGLNYIDIYHRSGLYPLSLPSGIGLEASGIVVACGDGVSALQVGDRVAYGAGPLGAYSEMRTIESARVTKIPDGVSDEVAAASLLKGMTAYYLLHETYRVARGETILFHAISGGVGLLALQWAKALGVEVIGTAGSSEKADLAKSYGCDHVILYREENVPARVQEITSGKGVPVVYDGVGKETFYDSLKCLSPRGLLVSFGSASGAISSFDLSLLAQYGSLYITRPTLMTYVRSEWELQKAARAVFQVLENKMVVPRIQNRYPLLSAAIAHRDLSARKTVGSCLLLP